MFLAHTPPLPYSDPWDHDFAQRLKMLCGSKLRVAYYYEQPNNSTFRYRAYNMAQVLNTHSEKGVSAGYFFQSDTPQVDVVAAQADVLVICRSGYNLAINQWINQFRKRGKRVLFDVDDLVVDTRYTHLLVNTLGLDSCDNQVWEDWFAMTSRMGRTLQLCDGAITTNDFLARRIEAAAQLPVCVVPNFMNREQVEVSSRIHALKQAGGFARDARIHVGYFSGSPSHRLDFALLEEALASVMEEDSRIHLVLVGYIEAGPELARFANRIQRHPFQDYVNLQRLVASVELNLMPLQSNIFTDCKSELKYFESAAVGTVSIASPSVNYAQCIRQGQNGYLSRAHEWGRIIRQAVSALDKYAMMAESANRDAMIRFVGPAHHNAICSAVGLS